MKINLAKSAGFCFGVKRAFEMALKTAALGKEVCMWGEIVHNEEVVRQIRKAGIKKITRLTRGENKILLIRAHGIDTKSMRKARRLGYEIVDATCPMVKEIQRIAQDMEKKGYQIIVIGDRQHDEVRGIIGHLKGRAIIIESPKRIPIYMLKAIKRAAVVVQSTQILEEVLKIVEILKGHIAELKFFNTICKPTTLRQGEIKIMPLENEVMIIIGSKHSANTRRLYEISKSLNKRSYWVNAKKDIRREWFAGAKTVGVTAGASTPDATTYDIIRYLKRNKLRVCPTPSQSHPRDE